MDYHKLKATSDLWDNNGVSTRKSTRYKGKARESEKQLIRKELDTLEQSKHDLVEMLNQEAEESLYCHYHGPCDRCLEREFLLGRIAHLED